jgi:hypothetical protein
MQQRKEERVLRKLQRGLIKINEDKTLAICFCHRNGLAGTHLTSKGRDIPFVKEVKYLVVIFDSGVTWKQHSDSVRNGLGLPRLGICGVQPSAEIAAPTK